MVSGLRTSPSSDSMTGADLSETGTLIQSLAVPPPPSRPLGRSTSQLSPSLAPLTRSCEVRLAPSHPEAPHRALHRTREQASYLPRGGLLRGGGKRPVSPDETVVIGARIALSAWPRPRRDRTMGTCASVTGAIVRDSALSRTNRGGDREMTRRGSEKRPAGTHPLPAGSSTRRWGRVRGRGWPRAGQDRDTGRAGAMRGVVSPGQPPRRAASATPLAVPLHRTQRRPAGRRPCGRPDRSPGRRGAYRWSASMRWRAPIPRPSRTHGTRRPDEPGALR